MMSSISQVSLIAANNSSMPLPSTNKDILKELYLYETELIMLAVKVYDFT